MKFAEPCTNIWNTEMFIVETEVPLNKKGQRTGCNPKEMKILETLVNCHKNRAKNTDEK